MADRDEIISFCDELLAIGEFDDYGPNGLQVPGSREVRKIVSGVSAHLDLIEAAGAADAQLLLAHHGLFWEFHQRALSEQMAARLRACFAADLNLAGYHLPLDAHPAIGNNALLCAELGLQPGAGFAAARGRQIGLIGSAPAALDRDELAGRLSARLGREPLVLGEGPASIQRIGIVSGAGASYVHEAVALGLDALITGEPAEHVTADSREGRIHFFAAGHHATETFGVRALGERIAAEFGVEHEFIEVPNPV